MVSKPQQNRVWPKYVAVCLKCDSRESGVSYGGRGLCRPCYDQERSAGRIEEWSCHKPTMYQANNAALQACMMVGVTQVSRSIGVPKDKVTEWAQTKVPKNRAVQLRRYIEYIENLIEEGMEISEKRLNLFPFENRPIEDRLSDAVEYFSFPDW